MTARATIRRRLRDERGIALVMALGFLTVLLIVGVIIGSYALTSTHTSTTGRSRQISFNLAEAGINNGLAILYNSANDPLDASLLPSRTDSFEGGTVTWGGALAASVWTITALGRVHNPTGAADLTRTLTRTVTITSSGGGLPGTWDRIYSDAFGHSCDTIIDKIVMPPVNFAARGNVCIKGNMGDGQIHAKLSGASVVIGGTVEFDVYSSMGSTVSPVGRADIGGTCKFGSATAHTPCTSVDKVYANTITTTPTGLTMPFVDFDSWYANAKPGPMQPCTSGSIAGQFDTNTTHDGSLAVFYITPPNATYDCQVWSGGTMVGQLAWNHSTHVLKITGTIFFDGDIYATDDLQLVNYQGRGTILTSGQWKQTEVWCAGGTGTNNCRTAGLATWNPSANLLLVAAGSKASAGHDDIHINKDDAAFQGILYGLHRCKLNDEIHLSGPNICGEWNPNTSAPTFYTWPPLGNTLPPIGGGTPTLVLGPQY